MAFMEPEAYKGKGWECENDRGETFYVPDYPEPETRANLRRDFGAVTARRVSGYFARMQAPGYLDATDWEFFRTKRELDEWEREQEEEEEDDDGDDDGEPNEPGEEDVTADDPNGPFYYLRKKIADTPAELRQWMTDNEYYPNIWWISDHGNPHLITNIDAWDDWGKSK